MPFLSQRRRRPEIMDQPGLDPGRHAGALQGLARINWLSGSAGILRRALLHLARDLPSPHLRILDVASGAGDVPVRLARTTRKRGLHWQFDACDISPTAVAFAQEKTRKAGAAVRFFVHDALRDPLPDGYDAVVCSLFLHHLDESDAVSLLRRLAGLDGGGQPRLVLVNDLARGPVGWAMAFAGTRLLTRSNVVHVDGPRSVEGAFTPMEALELARRAGLANATVERRWPFRWLLTWRRA
jgi:SAM-dependent methyltransferase